MINVAVIGTGYWGRNHTRVYKELKLEGMVDRVKVCDIDETRVQELGKTLGLEYTTNYQEIVADPSIQAVNIVTPSQTHYLLGKEFMEAGKDVLVEKPMTMRAEDAKRLVEVANSTGRILMVAHIFRYHPVVGELKRRIELGELGRIQSMVSNRLYFGLPRKDMGVIYALGTHELDMFCYLLNCDFPQSLIAIASSSFQPQIEETAMLALDFGYAKGYALESWLLPAYGKRRDLVVVGTEKSASIDYLNSQELIMFDSRIIVQDGKPIRAENEGKHIIPLLFAEPLKEELKHFLTCVNTRAKPLSDGVAGWRAVAMAEAALRSAKTGKSVKFNSDGYIEE